MDGASWGNPSCDHAQLIDSTLAPKPNADNEAVLLSTVKAGYRFVYVPTPLPNGLRPALTSEAAKQGCEFPGVSGYEMHADPVQRGSTGQRSFYTDQTGVIRFERDAPATTDSPPLE